MSHFKFTFHANGPSGSPPTKAQLEPIKKALIASISATALSISFTDNGNDMGVFTVIGTTNDLAALRFNADELIDDLPAIAGWVAGPEKVKFAEDKDPKGGRRRSSSKRVRKVTRRKRSKRRKTRARRSIKY